MRSIGADVIRVMHIGLIIFVCVMPFSGAETSAPYLLHLVVVAGLLFHWLFHTDVCALTLLESSLRGTTNDKSFIHSLVSPIFKIPDVKLRRLVMKITVILGLTSLSMLVVQVTRRGFLWCQT